MRPKLSRMRSADINRSVDSLIRSRSRQRWMRRLAGRKDGGAPILRPHFTRSRLTRPGVRLGLPWNMSQLETLPFKRGVPAANAGLRASLKAPDLQKRRRDLLDRFEREGDPDVQLEMA